MKKEVFEKMNLLMLNYGAELDKMLVMVKETCTAEEFEKYRKATGKIMGVMLLDIMNPIYAAFPELKPVELD